MEIMALLPQHIAALLNKFQEGNDADRQKKESEKSILKTMGPTQRALFAALCTRSMSREPEMLEFMTNLTTSNKSPRKLSTCCCRRPVTGTEHFQRAASTGCYRTGPSRRTQTGRIREGSPYSCSTPRQPTREAKPSEEERAAPNSCANISEWKSKNPPSSTI